jgi:hypothetical protein
LLLLFHLRHLLSIGRTVNDEVHHFHYQNPSI